jgi:ankyrin repeat protein
MNAADNGQRDIVDALLAHNCNLDLRNKKGETALMLAAEKGHRHVVEALLAYKCNLLDLQNNEGVTALMNAARNGNKYIVEVLLAHNCKLNLRNNDGRTALMIAKRRKHFEVVALIENQLRRNRIWDRRKDLMLVLARNNYLPRSSPLISSLSAAVNSEVDTGRVVHTPVVIQREDAALMTSSEKVLCNMFLVQHIMRYI